jgi:hypothetical protein
MTLVRVTIKIREKKATMDIYLDSCLVSQLPLHLQWRRRAGACGRWPEGTLALGRYQHRHTAGHGLCI